MANIFTYDIHCKALWRFESGALVTDSIGGNTLTNHGASADSSYYMEGSYSSLFERYEYMNITDSNLSTGFPFKSGDTNKKISVCFWARVARVYDGALLSKYDFSSGLRCFSIRYTSAGTFFIQLGYNSGGSYTNYTHGSTFPENTWQHITFSYDNSDRSYALRLRDASGNIVGTDLTGTAANDISITTAPLEVNSYNGGNNAQWGRIDELVFFDDIITAAEATQIAKGNYVPQANEPIPEQLHYYKNGIVNINIYPFSAGIDNYMNITYSGTQVGYIPIVSGNGTGSHPTDLRIYKDGIYTVQSER